MSDADELTASAGDGGGSKGPAAVDDTPTEPGSAAASIEELADDVLHLLRMVRALSTGQAELRSRMESWLGQLQQLQRQQAAELYNLRSETLGARRSQANRSAFDAIHPAIDQLELIRGGLSDDAASHVSVLLSSLRMVLRGLGFVSFSVDLGALFDPARMECIEYANGERGVVLAALRPGYEADGVVVRPCGVAIANPAGAQDDGGSIETETDE